MSSSFFSSESDNYKQLKEWKEKLAFYEKKSPIVSVTEQFTVYKIIQECKKNIGRLEAKIKNSLNQLIDEEDENNSLNNSSVNEQYNQTCLAVEQELSKFNFQATVDIIEEVINNFQTNNGTALFLLQNSISMGGEYFSARLREILRDKTSNGNFRHCLIEFKDFCQPKEIELLRKFSKYFPTDSLLESIEEYTNQIIDKICESIPQSGHILFLEISGLEYLLEKEKIMPWFIKDFWYGLATKLQDELSVKDYKMVRLICFMKTDDNIPNDFLPSHIYHKLANLNCSKLQELNTKVKELVIEPCSCKEIEIFLYTFGGFTDKKVRQIVELIDKTYKNGNPKLVCERLKRILTQK